MINRVQGDENFWHVYCDYCSYEIEVCADEFREVVDDLKHDGWHIHREDDGTWTHECPACAEDNTL